jgi:hypothetical protein
MGRKGFSGFGGGGNMQQILKQAQKMQEKMQKAQEELAEKTVEASSGGGMVKVVANGNQDILSVKLDPEVVDPEDVEMLEDLILAALSEAKRRAEEMMQESMSQVTGGLNIPGLF